MRRKNFVQSDLGIMLREDVAKAIEAIVKTLPSNQRNLRRKSVTTKSESVDESKRSEVSIITTNSLDMQGDVVIANGIDRTLFSRNPIVCLSHDMAVQCGNCEWIKPIENGLKAQTKYPAKPGWFEGKDWVPDHVFAMIQSGLMLGKSIGFVATNIRKAKSEELKTNPEWKDAQVIDGAILLEYSCCVSGVNQDALVLAINKGLKVNPKLLGLQGLKKSKAQQLMEVDWDRITREILCKYGLSL